MDKKEFKALFNDIAQKNNFEEQYGGWTKDSSECICILDLQKSQFGDYYQLMIKVYIQGLWGQTHIKGKQLLKNTGDVFRGAPSEYESAFKLDVPMNNQARKQQLESLFLDFLVPFVNEVLSKSGILRLKEKGALYLLPSVDEELRKF